MTHNTPRFGKAKIVTLQRDVNALRRAIRAHDSEATEAAWEKCKRWVSAIFKSDFDNTAQEVKA